MVPGMLHCGNRQSKPGLKKGTPPGALTASDVQGETETLSPFEADIGLWCIWG
jgi:hypothetical protein